MINRKRSKVTKVMDDYNRHLLNSERQQIIDMTTQWVRLENNLNDKLALLSQQIAERIRAGKPVSQSAIYQLDRYKALLRQAVIEANNYQRYAERLIASNQAEYGRLGIEAAQSAIRASMSEVGTVQTSFKTLPFEVIQNMVGNAGDGAPLFSVLKRRALAPVMVDGLRRQLVKAVAVGDNPRVTAKLMKDGLAQGLSKALVIARTEQLRVYRKASIDQYKASGVVKSFTRHCALNEHTCIACLALDGKVYDTDEEFDNHPQCRCFNTPNIEGFDIPSIESGEQWLSNQPEDVQKQILGSRFDDFKSGRSITDMYEIKENDVWGPTVTVR